MFHYPLSAAFDHAVAAPNWKTSETYWKLSAIQAFAVLKLKYSETIWIISVEFLEPRLHNDRMPPTPSDELDLTRLRALGRKKPRTKAAQVRQAWPEIRNLLAAGHALKDVCAWVNEIGLNIGYARLSDYVNKLRRAEHDFANSRSVDATAPVITLPPTAPAVTGRAEENPARHDPLANMRGSEAAPPQDPLANIRRGLARKRASGFHYDPFPKPLDDVAPRTDVPERGPEAPKPRDPLENYRRGLARRPAFDYRPELADPKKLL